MDNDQIETLEEKSTTESTVNEEHSELETEKEKSVTEAKAIEKPSELPTEQTTIEEPSELVATPAVINESSELTNDEANFEEPVIISSKPIIMESEPVVENPQPVITNSEESPLDGTTTLEEEIKQTKFDKKKLLLFGMIIIIIIAIIILLTIIFKINYSTKETTPTIKESNAFFMRDGKNYILFNEDGKRLTETNFSSGGEFLNGSAVVSNSKKEEGLISDTGKMLINFGTYKYIFRYGPYYIATSEEDDMLVDYFLDSNGKILKKGRFKGYDVIGCYDFMILNDYKNYVVYNSKGKEVASIPYDKEIKELDEFSDIAGMENYLSIYYNNKTYVVNTKTKLIATLDERLYLSNASKNTATLSLYYEDVLDDENIKKVIINDKVAYSKKDVDINNGNVLLESKLLDDKGNVISEDMISYIDNKNYAIYKDDNIELTVSGKIKANLKCEKDVSKAYAQEGIYLFKDCDDKKGYTYYTKEGKKINETPYLSAEVFDSAGIAIVEAEEDKYYLIDKSNNKVSGEYKKIYSLTPGFYVATKENDLEVILNKKGKELCTGKKIKEEYYGHAIYFDENDKANVYDLEKEKNIGVYDKTPYLREEYFEINRDDKLEYYSYTTGKMFFKQS